jgi:hypothetical protein
MQNRGLLFIPDISGFTHFVNSTEIEHSKLMILTTATNGWKELKMLKIPIITCQEWV